MSLTLSFSGDIECKTFPNFEDRGRGLLDNSIRVGDLLIHEDDMVELVMYYLTNTDLKDNDPRLKLVERVKSLLPAMGRTHPHNMHFVER